ncbi:hypothetical protein [Caldibacillus debilis]|jgi:hypothetical protein|uniref:hypothetical protein n=1 Tax=Caldibacillus debilis TaxID=301148 RepID=UPI0013659253|nr:hypothetical protein [Caldibacillus debilis]
MGKKKSAWSAVKPVPAKTAGPEGSWARSPSPSPARSRRLSMPGLPPFGFQKISE